eukprot:7391936-Prymnesium_polylepis.4
MFTKGTLSACYGPWTPVLVAEVLNLGPRVGFGPAGCEGARTQPGQMSMFAIEWRWSGASGRYPVRKTPQRGPEKVHTTGVNVRVRQPPSQSVKRTFEKRTAAQALFAVRRTATAVSRLMVSTFSMR